MGGLDCHAKAILRFIERYQNNCGRTPSYEEIRKATGMRSTDHVYRDVQALEAKGYVHRVPSISRGLALLRTADGYPVTPFSYTIPVLGTVSTKSGPVIPDAAVAPFDWVDVMRTMIPDAENVFAIRVQGNSMIDALVNDGDTVVLKRQDSANDGELAAVRIKNDRGNSGTTLKRIYHRENYVWLKSEDPASEALRFGANEIEIQGLVLCIIRQIPPSRATT